MNLLRIVLTLSETSHDLVTNSLLLFAFHLQQLVSHCNDCFRSQQRIVVISNPHIIVYLDHAESAFQVLRPSLYLQLVSLLLVLVHLIPHLVDLHPGRDSYLAALKEFEQVRRVVLYVVLHQFLCSAVVDVCRENHVTRRVLLRHWSGRVSTAFRASYETC